MKTSPLISPIKGEKEKVEEHSSPSLIRLSLYVSSFPPHMFGDTPTLFLFAIYLLLRLCYRIVSVPIYGSSSTNWCSKTTV